MDITHGPEEWRPVVGYEGLYEVSSHGRARSLDRTIVRVDGQVKRFKGKLLNPVIDRRGYSLIHFPSRNGAPRKIRRLHAKILEAFVGPRPDGYYGCHRDGDPSNNHLANLYWGTPTENSRDTLRHGRNRHANKTHCARMGHDLSDAYLTKSGGRQCRPCHLESCRLRRERRRQTE